MKGTIKDILNIPGVQGYIIAGRSGIQVKLPSKFNVVEAKERFGRLYNDLVSGKINPCNLVEIYTPNIALVIFCSTSPILIVVTSNIANLPLIRITGKLVYTNLAKETG